MSGDSSSSDDYGDVDLPQELLQAIGQDAEAADPLEQADFDVVRYVNDLFPDEESLQDVDAR